MRAPPDGDFPDRSGSRMQLISRTVGEFCITVGVLLGLFAVYQVWWTDLDSADKQEAANSRLEQRWSNPRSAGNDIIDVPDGGVFARMYIPTFGSDYRFAITKGTDAASLEIGPGHYLDTQLPGQPGNFAVAGHRTGRGSPFNDLDALQPCDAIVYETQQEWFIYRVAPIVTPDRPSAVEQATQCMSDDLADRATTGLYADLTGLSIVQPHNVGVLNPVPGVDHGVEPALLPIATLTTCHPRYSATERMIVHAVLVRTEARVPGITPIELKG